MISGHSEVRTVAQATTRATWWTFDRDEMNALLTNNTHATATAFALDRSILFFALFAEIALLKSRPSRLLCSCSPPSPPHRRSPLLLMVSIWSFLCTLVLPPGLLMLVMLTFPLPEFAMPATTKLVSLAMDIPFPLRSPLGEVTLFTVLFALTALVFASQSIAMCEAGGGAKGRSMEEKCVYAATAAAAATTAAAASPRCGCRFRPPARPSAHPCNYPATALPRRCAYTELTVCRPPLQGQGLAG